MKIFLLILILLLAGTVYSQTFPPKNLSDINKKDYLKQLDNQLFASYTYIHNLGRFGDYYKDGSGGYLNYGMYFPNSWLAVARTGYIKQNLRPGVDSGGYKDFGILPVHVGGRFYVYKDIIMPYFSFMNGINIISASNFVGNGGPGDQTVIRYAFQVGFGIDVKFVKSFGINMNINFNNSFWEDYDVFDQQNSKMMTGFEYSGGLIYNFGR